MKLVQPYYESVASGLILIHCTGLLILNQTALEPMSPWLRRFSARQLPLTGMPNRVGSKNPRERFVCHSAFAASIHKPPHMEMRETPPSVWSNLIVRLQDFGKSRDKSKLHSMLTTRDIPFGQLGFNAKCLRQIYLKHSSKTLFKYSLLLHQIQTCTAVHQNLDRNIYLVCIASRICVGCTVRASSRGLSAALEVVRVAKLSDRQRADPRQRFFPAVTDRHSQLHPTTSTSGTVPDGNLQVFVV